MDNLHFSFSGELRIYNAAKATWFFITLPKDDADQIKFFTGDNKRGWGSVPVLVTVGDTQWKTSIFPDSKSGSYVLPVKAEVRKKEEIGEGDMVPIELSVRT